MMATHEGADGTDRTADAASESSAPGPPANLSPPGAPASCSGSGDGLSNCGSPGESCCASLDVPGGTYDRSYANTGSGPTDAGDPATLSGFRLDKYLVTVGRFRQFALAWKNGYAPPAASGKHAYLNDGLGLANSADPGTYESGWDAADWNAEIAPTDANLSTGEYCESMGVWTPAPGANESLPINCENWYEAYAFCIWDGGFLPSEAEFEYAAAGGSQEREYPWGSTDPGSANQYAIYDCDYPTPSLFNTNCHEAPVGTAKAGAGLWGQLDLAGELWEWNFDVWSAAYVNPCVDCAYATGSCSCRTLRGGTYAAPASSLAPERTTAASNPSSEFDTPDTRSDGIGFRCARSP